MAFEVDAHHVPGLALVPVCRRPDADDARRGFAVVEPDLHADTPRLAGAGIDAKQVVVDGEALGLRLGSALQRGRAGRVEVAARGAPPVAGDGLFAPAEVVDGREVGQEVEAERVAQVEAGLDEARRIDDERLLAVCLLRLHHAGNGFVDHSATPRISYAGGTPACTFSCSLTMPSISASGRGGQPGTWTSTGTILSTPWSVV